MSDTPTPPKEPQQADCPSATCSAWEETLPQEWQDALNALYGKYATNPTNAQKVNILIREVGDCGVSYSGMWKDTPEDHERMKMHVMEMEYLEKIGLHKPDLC
jgi:hypothetical protein